MDTDRKLIKFSAATGFSVVLEFGTIEKMKEYKKKSKMPDCNAKPSRALI